MRDAIVLAAHTHKTCLFRWKNQAGTITQFISYSRQLNVTDEYREESGKGEEYFTNSNLSRFKPKQMEVMQESFIPYYEPFTFYRTSGGFNVLDVTEDGVCVDLYIGNLEKKVKRIKLAD